MGPKPTAVDQAGRPPRNPRALSLRFELSAYFEASNPAEFITCIIVSRSIFSSVIIIPEFSWCDISALITPLVEANTDSSRVEHPPQLMPLIFRL